MRTRASHLIVGLLAAGLLLGACGSPGGGSDAGAGRDLESPVTSTPEPTPIEPGGRPTARPVDITPDLENVRTTAFDEHRVVDGDELKLYFWGGVEECYGVDHVNIEYGNDVVIATIFYGSKPHAEVCIEIAEYQVVTVPLDEPLGGRKIVDGSQAAP